MRGKSALASLLLPCLLLFPACGALARDAAPAATGSSGVIDGAPWRIDIPADWNGDLVVQMHGYEMVGAPRPDVSAPGEDAGVFLEEGYAVAASSYATQGWAIADGIADSERLRRHFVATHGEPGRTLAVGYSMGGHVALATLEKFGEHYDGALSLCGVNAPAAEVFAHGIVAPLVAVEHFFPGAMGLAEGGLADPASPPMLDGEALATAFATNEAAATRIADSLGVPRESLVDSLWLYYVILREAQQRAGGHPVDNTTARYSGYGEDDAFNAAVPRYAGDPAAIAYIEGNFDLDGEIDKPVVLLSNAVDPIVPRRFGVRYIELVRAAGNDGLLTVLPAVGEGHCNFTPAQVRAGLDALEAAIGAR
ncbi:MAG TPA: hypothetical protein VFM73_05935 [Xanthomonadaceae bacterium]|nr:hypothetical protein [Xanthomonadaceae bacterium]